METMRQPGRLADRADGHAGDMTLSRLRHDIRNHLNAIKLSSALLHRQVTEPLARESVEDIERAADCINDLITRHLSDSGIRALLEESDRR